MTKINTDVDKTLKLLAKLKQFTKNYIISTFRPTKVLPLFRKSVHL